MFLHGPAGRTAEDELLVQVHGMFAEYERAKLLERYRRGKLHKAQRGLVSPLAGAPSGYKYIPQNDQTPASYQILLHEAKGPTGSASSAGAIIWTQALSGAAANLLPRSTTVNSGDSR